MYWQRLRHSNLPLRNRGMTAAPEEAQHSHVSPQQARAHAAAAADIAAPRREFYVAPPAWLASHILPLLRDEGDAPILWLLLNICCSAPPCAAALYACGVRSHTVGAAYLAATFGLFLQRFLLGLHVTEHCPLFRSRGG